MEKKQSKTPFMAVQNAVLCKNIRSTLPLIQCDIVETQNHCDFIEIEMHGDLRWFKDELVTHMMILQCFASIFLT